MRALVFAILNLAIIAGIATAQQSELTFPLQQELTLQEFVRFEKAKGASIEQYGSNMTVTLSKSIYPFINKYKLAQPVHGSRVVDSTKVSFECYFTQADSVAKFVSYNLGPDKPSLQDVFQQLQREGKTSQEEINKAIERVENDPQLPQQNTAIYQRLREYFAEQWEEPTIIPDKEDIILHSRLSWQKDNLYVLLAYKGEDRKKSGVIVRTYWE